MAEFDVEAYLLTKGYTGRKATGSEVAYPCFFDCNEPSASRKKKLYVNMEDGWFHCKVCDCNGGTYLLQKHFGDDPKERNDVGPDPIVRRLLLTEATAVGQEMLNQSDDFLLYLDDRGFDMQTIEKFKLGCVINSWSLTKTIPSNPSIADLKTTGLVYRDGPREGKDFFYDHLLIPYLSRGSTIQIRGRENPLKPSDGKHKYLSGAGEPCYLFNQDSLDGAKEVIITEGELDCISIVQALQKSTEEKVRNIAVVALAGVGSQPPNFLDFFAECKYVYIGLDSDEAGLRAAEKLKEQLGAKARIVKLPVAESGRKCDWNEYLLPDKTDADELWKAKHVFRGHDWRDVVNLLATARGKRIFSISESGASYRAYKKAMPEGIKTGYKTLDAVLRPGLLPGQVMVALAKTGCIQGDAIIGVHRQGKTFKMKIRDLCERWEGSKCSWGQTKPVYVQREIDGEVSYGILANVWRSGIKKTFTVTTEKGKTIRATDEHPFLTDHGWERLDALRIGDSVHMRGKLAIGAKNEMIILDRIRSIEPYGLEETYDIEVVDDPHNFIANDFVVHNTGKTVLLCNLAYQMREYGILFLSLEMTQEEIYERIRKVYLFHHPAASDDELEQAYSKVFICDENRLGERDISLLVDEYEEETGNRPKVILLDYLGYYARGSKGNSPYEKVSNAVMQLKEEAKKGKKFVIIAPAQVNRGTNDGKPIELDAARDAGAVEETADFLISLYRPDSGLTAAPGEDAPQSWRMILGVLKSRHGGAGAKCAIQGDPLSLVMVNADTHDARRAEKHARDYERGYSWDDMRREELREISKGTQRMLPTGGTR